MQHSKCDWQQWLITPYSVQSPSLTRSSLHAMLLTTTPALFSPGEGLGKLPDLWHSISSNSMTPSSITLCTKKNYFLSSMPSKKWQIELLGVPVLVYTNLRILPLSTISPVVRPDGRNTYHNLMSPCATSMAHVMLSLMHLVLPLCHLVERTSLSSMPSTFPLFWPLY